MKIHQAKDLRVGDIIWKNHDKKFLVKSIKREFLTKYLIIELKELFGSRSTFNKRIIFNYIFDCLCERKEEIFNFEMYL